MATTPTLNNYKIGFIIVNSEDQLESLRADIRNHRNKALMFEFFAAHLFDDIYELAEDDLHRLEITRRH